MNTAVIQIGNSDDKLSQLRWHQFVIDVQTKLSIWEFDIHFAGVSPSANSWQNACWVIGMENSVKLNLLRDELGNLARKYNQDSIALTLGNTEFVTGG